MAESSSSEALRPIIVIKKKAGHGGHHGGAWKVAYADFVTAMMALFIVLWLMSTSQEVKQAVGGYFLDPKGHGKQAGSAITGRGESLNIKQNQMDQLKTKIQQALKQLPEIQKLEKNIKMTVTGEGLRIELLESAKGMFFESGSPKPSADGTELLIKLAQELGAIPNSILIEGHTDAKPFPSDAYTNWELSADRANAARRIMQTNGLRPDQVTQVRGYADQQLRDPSHPEDASNRRITVIVRYLDAVPLPTAAAASQPSAKPSVPPALASKAPPPHH